MVILSNIERPIFIHFQEVRSSRRFLASGSRHVRARGGLTNIVHITRIELCEGQINILTVLGDEQATIEKFTISKLIPFYFLPVVETPCGAKEPT